MNFMSLITCFSLVVRMDPPKLHLDKINASNPEALLLDLHLSIPYGFVSFKIYDTRNDIDFDVVNVPLFGWIFLCLFVSLFYLLRYLPFSTRVSSNVTDFNAVIKC